MTRRPVWIDLANSPHVLFFGPVLEELASRDVPVVVTARDFAQTVPLCQRFGVPARVIGSHGGAGTRAKGAQVARRAAALRGFARQHLPCVAVSHNSYAQALAARSLDVPVVTAMDYEFQPANHLAFRCASLVAVPDVFPLDVLRAQGGRDVRVWRYPGVKEEIALAGFRADPGYLARMGIAGERPLVVIRPPASTALYHRFANPLFERLLAHVTRNPDVRALVLARTGEQAEALEREGFADVLWRGEALDGRELAAAADAVVSAGGSMNREAAVLGTPAYSVYAGRVAGVDRALAAQGRLTFIRTEEDVDALRFQRKGGEAPAVIGDRLLQTFVDRILEMAR